MNSPRRFAMFILGLMSLLIPAHGLILADQLVGPIISAGSVTTDNGSLLNVGQSAIGNARSTSHMMFAGGIPVIVQLSMSPLQGDIDGDGDVDEDDYIIFAACMNGPDVSYFPMRTCTQEHFDLADIQNDNDVDLVDYSFLSLSYMAR